MPLMKHSEGRHYHDSFHKRAQQFCIVFSSILVTFWSAGMILATSQGSLGPGPHFLLKCELLLDAP